MGVVCDWGVASCLRLEYAVSMESGVLVLVDPLSERRRNGSQDDYTHRRHVVSGAVN